MEENNKVNLGYEETACESMTVSQFAKVLKLRILGANPNSEIRLTTVSVNRPGLILSGIDDYFAHSRVQVLGNAEMYYLYQMSDIDRIRARTRLRKLKFRVVISRSLEL